MARRQVIEVECDRCGRKETQDPSTMPEAGIEFTATFHGSNVTYKDMCRRCRKAIEGYFSNIDLSKPDEANDPVISDESEKKSGFLGLGKKAS